MLMIQRRQDSSVRVHTAGELTLDIAGIPQPPAWTIDALCAQIDLDGFFPEKGGSNRDAKKVCGECSVISQCLKYALDNEERFGVWGGKSERERRRMLAEHRAAQGPTERVCRLDECEVVIDGDAPRVRIYCTAKHASLQAGRNYAKRGGRRAS